MAAIDPVLDVRRVFEAAYAAPAAPG
jgi:hypothetical protein